MHGHVRFQPVVALAVAALLLGACNPPESVIVETTPATEPAKPIIAEQPPFSWQALAPTTMSSEGPPALLSLSGGYGSLIYSTTAVTPGQTVTFEFVAAGPKDGPLRVVLMRHCGDGPEDDSASEVFALTGAPQKVLIQHTFKSAHPCLRVMFATPAGEAMNVSIDQWLLKVSPPQPPVAPASTPAVPPTPAPTPAPPPAPATPPASAAPPQPN